MSDTPKATIASISAKGDEDESDKNVQQWKIKKMIEGLEAARGNGTSMISLIIRPKDQLAGITKMLAEEYGTATNIKSRVNRLSVLSAITSTQNRLKLYNKVPTNGLVIYCGTVMTEDNKEKLVNIDFEPFKPINTSLYLCHNKFHTEPLRELLESDDKFVFLVMDGSGTLFATLQGNNREILHRFAVDLPKKHGRGGQSALRFARLRLEKRHNYVRKVAELAVQFFISNDKPNISGLILAGLADFKTELNASDMFDPRLQGIVLKVVDVSYGGENGLSQAIELVAEDLGNVRFIREKAIITQFFDEIAKDTGKYCFGIEETLKGLELGAVETLIVWENLEITRFVLKNPSSGEEKVLNLRNEQIQTESQHFRDEATGVELDIIDQGSFLEWMTMFYKKCGCKMEIVTNRSQEGSQFCKGFGGIGGILRYKVDLTEYEDEDGGDAQINEEDFM